MPWANFLFSNLAIFCENFCEILTKPSGHTDSLSKIFSLRQSGSPILLKTKLGRGLKGMKKLGKIKEIEKKPDWVKILVSLRIFGNDKLMKLNDYRRDFKRFIRRQKNGSQFIF